jgi:hypothetical protein
MGRDRRDHLLDLRYTRPLAGADGFLDAAGAGGVSAAPFGAIRASRVQPRTRLLLLLGCAMAKP